MQETAQQYTQRLLGHVEGKDPLRVQKETPNKLAALVRRLSKSQAARRPAPGKWSIIEILAHLADAELVISWRLRQMLAANGTPIQAYDQDVWAETFRYDHRDAKRSLETFRLLRQNNLDLLNSIPKDLWENYGIHSERGKETIAHTARMIAGHDLNHIRQVEQIVKNGKSRTR